MAKREKSGRVSGLVYSTDPDAVTDAHDTPAETALPPAEQDLRLTLDKKLKGGKVATVVYAFQGPDDALAELGKQLKHRCGVGGTTKNGEIILQGNHLKTVADELTRLGYRFKLAGV